MKVWSENVDSDDGQNEEYKDQNILKRELRFNKIWYSANDWQKINKIYPDLDHLRSCRDVSWWGINIANRG